MGEETGGWYYVRGGETVGPMSRSELLAGLKTGDGEKTLVWGPGVPEWTEARHVASLRSELACVPPPPRTGTPRRADEIEYELFGDDMQFVEVTLDPGEMVVADAGSMMYMTAGIEMETVFGDPSKQQSLFGKLLDAGKRVLTGESLFLTTFAARGAATRAGVLRRALPGQDSPDAPGRVGG